MYNHIKVKTMKYLLLLIIITGLNISVFSQNNQHEKAAKKVLSTWIEVCDLDKKTQDALYLVLLEKQNAVYIAKIKYGNNSDELAAAKKEIGKEFSPKIKAIVGADNAKKMNEYWKSQRN